MAIPTFRNPDLFQVLPIRAFFRGECGFDFPSGGGGFVVEDLDLLIRWYGPGFDLDGDGRFRLVELKHKGSTIGTAQRRTFGLMDKLLRQGDTDGTHYDGYYLVQMYPAESDPPDSITRDTAWKVNGEDMTTEQFRDWSLSPKSTVDGFFV